MNSAVRDPYFSVIVPTYNRAELLSKCIDSILKQQFKNFELVIIDDGSTDETRNLIASLNEKKIRYHYKKHGERSSARNKGIELSKGNHICFVDDDDFVHEDYLQSFYDAIQEFGEDKIIRCGFYKMTNGQSIKMANYDSKNFSNPVHFFCFNMCGVGSLAIPSSYLKKEQFPPQFPHWQDTHLFLRLFAQHPFVQIDNYSYVYLVHQKMGSRQNFEGNESETSKRIELNVAAIKDLFDHHADLITPYLPHKTKEKLISEKYLQHAVNCLRRKQTKLGRSFFKKAKAQGIFFRNWKMTLLYYLKIITPF